MPHKTAEQRNPVWTRDEIILALDVYFRFPPPHSGQEARRAISDLSQLLRKLPIHPERPDKERFRNVNGVNLKLSNLQYHDSLHLRGSSNGSALDGEIFKEFQNDKERLYAIANAVRENANNLLILKTPEADFDEISAYEGQVLLRLHKQRERNPKLVELRKLKALKENGHLQCEVCGFNFQERYGQLGKGFIECHHRKPISQLKAEDKTRLSDLALVCANCHRMLHRADKVLRIQDLKSLLQNMKT